MYMCEQLARPVRIYNSVCGAMTTNISRAWRAHEPQLERLRLPKNYFK